MSRGPWQSSAIRSAVIAEVLAGGSTSEAAARHGVNPSTARNWLVATPELRTARGNLPDWRTLAHQVLYACLLAIGDGLTRLGDAPPELAVRAAADAARVTAEIVLSAEALGLGTINVTPRDGPDDPALQPQPGSTT